jgi:hypothetical protein
VLYVVTLIGSDADGSDDPLKITVVRVGPHSVTTWSSAFVKTPSSAHNPACRWIPALNGTTPPQPSADDGRSQQAAAAAATTDAPPVGRCAADEVQMIEDLRTAEGDPFFHVDTAGGDSGGPGTCQVGGPAVSPRSVSLSLCLSLSLSLSLSNGLFDWD